MKKLNNEQFIEKAKLIHGDKYVYSLVEYIDSSSKVRILCEEHGSFEQTPNSHLTGRGCHKCGNNERIIKQRMDNGLFIEKAKLIHGDKYNYTLVKYINNKTKVTLKCNEHGNFELKPNCHLTGGGCPRCVGRGKTTEDFINESIIKHGNKYDYSLSNYISTHNKLNIICPIHGSFEQTPNHHLNGAGCPICHDSIGEREIKKVLDKKNILYIPQKRFIDCRDIKPLPFDFYLPTYNICIEYQGEQHFKPINYFGGVDKFKTQQKRDKIKHDYCKDKGVCLILIKYNENVNDKLKYVC